MTPPNPTSQAALHPFEKWHGLGNDFVVVRDAPDEAWWRANAARLCDRHRGIGADGILLVTTEPPRMVVVNADGSEPEMCGNGLRCVASAIGRATQKPQFDVLTGVGALPCRVEPGADEIWTVTVNAGTPSFVAGDAGVEAEGVRAEDADVWLERDGLRGLVTSVGNPHWLFFDHPGVAELSRLGPALETDPRWTARTNVEFVTRRTDVSWQVDVWERGVGITQACGTGATAVAAALVHTGRAPAGVPLSIHLPGGPLEITVAADGSTVVRGPAQRVFAGTVE